VQSFEHLTFPATRFEPHLLAELLESASETVHLDCDDVVIDQLYVERRVTPLDLYVRRASPTHARSAVVDFGRAIKELAANDIFRHLHDRYGKEALVDYWQRLGRDHYRQRNARWRAGGRVAVACHVPAAMAPVARSVSLWHSCRTAKERLLQPLGDDPAESGGHPDTHTLTVQGRGSKLIGGAVLAIVATAAFFGMKAYRAHQETVVQGEYLAALQSEDPESFVRANTGNPLAGLMAPREAGASLEDEDLEKARSWYEMALTSLRGEPLEGKARLGLASLDHHSLQARDRLVVEPDQLEACRPAPVADWAGTARDGLNRDDHVIGKPQLEG